jgi:hypothetical protein
MSDIKQVYTAPVYKTQFYVVESTESAFEHQTDVQAILDTMTDIGPFGPTCHTVALHVNESVVKYITTIVRSVLVRAGFYTEVDVG